MCVPITTVNMFLGSAAQIADGVITAAKLTGSTGALQYLRRNAGNTAYEWATSPNMITSLGKTTLGAAADIITVAGLTLSGYSYLEFLAKVSQTSGANVVWSLYVNGDETATNYYSDGANTAAMGTGGNATTDMLIYGNCAISSRGYFLANTRFTEMSSGTPADTLLTARAISKTSATIANITSLSIKDSGTNAMASGDFLAVWGYV